MGENTDLNFATTEDLLEELKRRSDSLVVGMLPLAGRGEFLIRCHGPALQTLGLNQLVHESAMLWARKASGLQDQT